MSDIYLSLTETPTVVTLSQPVISGALSSTVTVANTVTVALDANSLSALEQVTVTVGAAVSVSNFPASQVVSVSNFPVSSSVTVANFPSVTTVAGSVAVSNFPASSSVTIGGFSTSSLPPSTVTVANTVTIAGTVTANGGNFLNADNALITRDSASNIVLVGGLYYSATPTQSAIDAIRTDGNGAVVVYSSQTNWTDTNAGNQTRSASQQTPFPVQILGGSVTIGSIPAISGTVTANVGVGSKIMILDSNGDNIISNPLNGALEVHVKNSVTIGSLPAISGTVTARLQDASGNNLTSTSIGGVQRLNVSLASAATAGGTLPSFINIHGGTDGSVARTMLLDSSGRTVVTVSNFPATQPVSLTSTTVTVSSLPSGALTTRFGSVTTANTAQITSAVTNTSRKYLLAQNISTGSVTIGIGFSPTTTQGIQLTAGAGLTFDAFCPTGAVYWLGAVTGAAFTILEG